MDEFLALGEISGKEKEVLTTDFLTDFFDNGYDETPEDNGAQGLRTVHGCPKIVGAIVGTEMNQFDSGEGLADTGDALVKLMFQVFEDGATLLGKSIEICLGNALAGAEFLANQINQPPVVAAKVASTGDGVEIGVEVANEFQLTGVKKLVVEQTAFKGKEEQDASILVFHQIVGGGTVFVLYKGLVAQGISNTIVTPVEEVINQTEIIGIGG